MLEKAGEESHPQSGGSANSRKKKNICGWTEVVKPAKQEYNCWYNVFSCQFGDPHVERKSMQQMKMTRPTCNVTISFKI